VTESVAKDLEAFAKHAGRSQINSDDVMLLTRRNEGLEAVLRSYLENQRSNQGNEATRGGRK
jgi:centromere protein S